MWNQYRKTLMVTQTLTALVCAGALFFGKAPLQAVLFLFVVMQISAVFGAAWATNLKRRINRHADALPLMKRR